MNLNIWKQNRFTNIQPNGFVNTFKNVLSFAAANNLRANAVVKSQGGYYLIQKLDGTQRHVFTTLNNITFNDLFKHTQQ